MCGINHTAPCIVLTVIGNEYRNTKTGILPQCLHCVMINNLLIRCAVCVIQMCRNGKLMYIVPHGIASACHGAAYFFAFTRNVKRNFRVEHVPLVCKIHASRIAGGIYMIEQACFFMNIHLANQIPDTVVNVCPPVLVNIQLTVSV